MMRYEGALSTVGLRRQPIRTWKSANWGEGHRQGALVVVDNTTATCLGQRPLELGANISLASGTKALTGHADLRFGYVSSRDVALVSKLDTWRAQHGAIVGPMEAWLAHRSLATLYVRFRQQCQNALLVAEFLSSHPRVKSVRYPGLPADPAHAVAACQMDYFGPIVSFVLDSKSAAEQFLQS